MKQTLQAIQRKFFSFGKAKTPVVSKSPVPASASASASAARTDKLSALEERVNIKFKNSALLEQALTHPSGSPRGAGDNARLEFLGDSVIGLTVTHLLYESNPLAQEGELTRWKSYLVSSKFLADLADSLQLGPCLKVGQTEKRSVHPTASMLEAAFESFIGAIYLDQGVQKAFDFLQGLYRTHLKIPEKEEKNPKGVLQETLQQKYREQPHYSVASEKGPAHAKVFEVQVSFRGKVFGIGRGKSKKEAEKEAAREALAVLDRE